VISISEKCYNTVEEMEADFDGKKEKNEELESDSVVANFATTVRDGKTYQVEYYNLNAII
jgi:hypothetical protein